MKGGRAYEMPGWCRNLLEAGRLRGGEEVLVFVDEPLVEHGSQLSTAVKEAGGRPTFELWVGNRPMRHAPQPILAAAGRATLAFFLSQDPHRPGLVERVRSCAATLRRKT